MTSLLILINEFSNIFINDINFLIKKLEKIFLAKKLYIS